MFWHLLTVFAIVLVARVAYERRKVMGENKAANRGDNSLCTNFSCKVSALPRWIPVTERLPKDNEKEVYK